MTGSSGCGWRRRWPAASDDHVQASAYNAYLKSTDPVERGNALFLIGRDYDRHDKYKEALAAFEAGLALTQSAAVAERVEQLKRLVAFRVTKVEIEAEAEAPRACLRFNEKIATKGDVSYGAFVRSEPALDGIVTVRGDTLCLNGLKHGETYELRAARRLPGRDRREDRRDLHRPRRRPRPQAVDQLCRHRLCAAARGHRRAAGHDGQSRPGQAAAAADQRAQPGAEHRRRKTDDELRLATMSTRSSTRTGKPRLGRRDGDRRRAQPPGRRPRSR